MHPNDELLIKNIKKILDEDLPISGIVKMLEERKKYHTDQLAKIDMALRAVNVPVRRRIRWTREVLLVFTSNPRKSFHPFEIREILEGKGLFLSKGTRNAIYTSIARLLKRGEIKKLRDGSYRAGKERI